MASGLLAILSKAKPGKPSEESAEPKGMSESTEDPGMEYGDELASILGVSEDDKQAFLDALSGYVRSCGSGE